ncbi:MAG TPA: glycoside hydrolase family 28 protein [Opitutaceae bacterium]|nr:glycoside hydrolase family 28 protein [Opitutaceae bacterium]
MPPPKTDLASDDGLRVREAPAAPLRDRPAADEGGDPWREVPAILARIPELVFPDRDFLVTDFGATGDGRTDAQAGLLRAIATCSEQGGGRVVVPPGDYLTGPLTLASHVNLHLAAGATLRFVADSCRYFPAVLTRWEGIECLATAPLIQARQQHHLAVTGEGTIDGGAGPGRWWDWAGPWDGDEPTGWAPGQPDQRPARRRMQAWGEADTPVAQRVFAAADLIRPMGVQLHRCHDVLVAGVTLCNLPMWGVHPVFSRAVAVRGVRVVSRGPNNDGCVPDSSRDVLIEDCHFDTGDDCVAIKSGRNRDGRRVGVAAEDIVIRGCRMGEGHSGVAIGSEISGGVRRVFIDRCVMNSAHLDQALRLKGNSARGGKVEQIRVRDVEVGRVREAAVRVDLGYDAAEEPGDQPPVVRDLRVERLRCAQSGRAVWIEGLPARPVRRVELIDCGFDRVGAPNVLTHIEEFSARGTVFPAPA